LTLRRTGESPSLSWRDGGGQDAARKRQTFKDLVHLAAEPSERAAELHVLGERPIHFLQTSQSKASWGLDRFPSTKELFQKHFGTLDTTIADFTKGSGSHVQVIDLEVRLPHLFAE
jgi:hypothetical protein